MAAMRNLKQAIQEKYKYQKLAAQAMGINDGNLSKLISKGEPEKLQIETINNLKKGFPEYNIDWLLEKSGIKLKGQEANLTPISSTNESNADIESNARAIGSLLHKDDDDENTKFVEISPGRYRMKVELVAETAKAGYLAGFSDPEYREELPLHEITVQQYHKGKYMAFEISGDSMFDGTHESILDKSIVIGRKIKKDFWKYKLYTHRWPNWIFVLKDGIVCKRIRKQDAENGIITLYSLNPDKEEYPDFDVHVDDIYEIFNITNIERSF